MSKKRIEWVDAYKGLLILSVILGHAIQETLKVRGIGFEDNIWRNLIYSFHMPAFMAMSGYLVYRPDVVGGASCCLSLIYKRFRQLVVPFLIWSIPLFLVYHNVEHIYDYLLYPNKGYWFLWALFFIIVIYNIVDWGCRKIHLKQEFGIFLIMFLLIGIQMSLPDAKLLGFEYIAYYFIFYMMGYYANKYKEKLPKNTMVVWTIFALWLAMACFWTPNGLPFFLEQIPYMPTKILQLGYRMLVPMMFILWMYSIAPKVMVNDNMIWKLLIELGQISLGMYAAHMVVKNLFAQILLNMLPVFPIWSHVIIEFAVLTIMSLFVVRYMLKWKFTSKWLLGK